MVDKAAKLSVVKQCQLLGVSRASVYYQSAAVPAEDLEIMRLLDELHLARPFLGSRRLVDELTDRGFHVNRKRVQRLMRLMGIEALCPKPRTSVAAKAHKIYPYLLRDLKVERVNQVWVTDITYIPMARGFCYLVAIMDLYSRKILSWRLSNSMDVSFCVLALEQALDVYGCPDIFNTDQGAQFTASAFTQALELRGIRISMDGKGRWIDNVFIERFWRSLKYEEVYLYAYDDLNRAREGIGHYMNYYNTQRRHSSLDRKTPDEVYTSSLNIEPTIQTIPKAAALTTRPCS